METFRNLRERSRTFIEQQRAFIEQQQAQLQQQNVSLNTAIENLVLGPPPPSSGSSSSSSSSSGGGGGGGGQLSTSFLTITSTLNLSGTLYGGSVQSGGSPGQEDDDEAPSVLSDRIPAPHAALDDGTTIKTVLVRAYETRNFPSLHTVYVLDVCTLTNSWTVCRRYSDFDELNNKLKRKFGGIQASLPSKTHNKFAEKILETRKNGLENYLKSIVAMSAVAKSEAVYSFLEVHLYDVAAVVNMLALEGIGSADGFLEEAQFKFPLNPTFLYCISNRIHQVYPDYHKGYDFTLVPTDLPSHFLRFVVFVQKLKTLKVSSGYWKRPAADPTEEYSSYRDPAFDISVFESLKFLHIRDFNLQLFRNVHVIQQQILEIECISNNLEELKDLLIHFANTSQNTKNIVSKSWANLRKLSVSKNKLFQFDESLAMAPNLGELDVSYNSFQSMEGLQFLQLLHKLDMSYNRISSLDNLNVILGNIRTLILSNNQIESLQGAEKLYSLQHLDLSFNAIVELNETNRLDELPFLEELVLRGNACCEQRNYRVHVLAHLGERASLVTLDGEAQGAREKDEVAELQERIKREKAKVTTKALIAKKKTKTRVVDILPPKKKKDKKDVVAEYANTDADFNLNGASVADSLNLDVEKILSKYGGEMGSSSTEALYEADGLSSIASSSTVHALPSASHSEESLGRHSAVVLESPEEANQIKEELAQEAERQREKAAEEERAKEREREKDRERERKKIEKERETERILEQEKRKAKEVSPDMARVLEKFKKKEDLSHDSPVSFIGCFNESNAELRYYSIFNFDLENGILLEIDEDTGKLKGNWPFGTINMRLAIEKAKENPKNKMKQCQIIAKLAEHEKEKPVIFLQLLKEAEPIRVFSLENMQSFTDMCALMQALLEVHGGQATEPLSPRGSVFSTPRSLSPVSEQGISFEQLDQTVNREFLGTVTLFLKSNAGLKEPKITACLWAPFLMLQASQGKERLALVVVTEEKLFVVEYSPVKRDLEARGTILLTISLGTIKQLTVGFFDQFVRLETDPKTTVTILTRNPMKTNSLVQSITNHLKGSPPPPKRYATADVAEELMTYLSLEDASQGLQVVDYMLAFQKHKDGAGQPSQVPRTLILTQTALYLLDEDYTGWPHPVFAESYDYLVRPPYKTLAQFLISDLVCLEISKAVPTSFNLIFENKGQGQGQGQAMLTWELSCTRGKQRTQFQTLLNANWSRLFGSDLLVTEF